MDQDYRLTLRALAILVVIGLDATSENRFANFGGCVSC
jgi:hypothetical protein